MCGGLWWGAYAHVWQRITAAEPAMLVTSQAHKGAARFASGEGRHGAFSTPGGVASGGTGSGADGSASRDFDAVLFDLGGVIVNSPFVQVRRRRGGVHAT